MLFRSGYSSGTQVTAGRAEEMSHLFFGQVQQRLWSGFATHPPIAKRIKRIDPAWDGMFLTSTPPAEGHSGDETASDPSHQAALAALTVAAAATTPTISESVSAGPSGSSDKAEALLLETRDPFGAMALVLALVWDPTHEKTQWRALEAKPVAGLSVTIRRWCQPVRARNAAQRLTLLELCLPTLKGLSKIGRAHV
mgnify:CR=1 FL=1